MTGICKGLFCALAVMGALLLSGPAFAQECDPDDIVIYEDCPDVNEPNETFIEMHDCPQIQCWKSYRRACGLSTWTLIYSGTSNVFCDTESDFGSCVQYRGEGYTNVTGSSCSGTLSAQGETQCPGGC
jgi:hypothetical protein